MHSEPAAILLLYFVLPVWLLAGVADWFCHRASAIERTTGAKESIIHLMMFGEAGAALIAGLFLEFDALVIVFVLAMLALHEATGWWDIGYATPRRNVTDVEQHAHSFLEVMPFLAVALVLVLHWPQFLALVGLGSEPANFAIELKRVPLPLAYVVAVLGAAFLFEIVPYSEELIRCLRASGGRLTPPHPDKGSWKR